MLVLLFIVFVGFVVLVGYCLILDFYNFDNFWVIEKGDGYGGGGVYVYVIVFL